MKPFWTIPLALSLQGCDLLTETPDDFLTPDNFYRTAQDAESAVISAYAPLISSQAFGNNLWRALETASDMARVGEREGNGEIRALGIMSYSADNPNVTNAWRAFFTTITRANLLIDRLAQVQASAEAKAKVEAEAKFLRAFAYFHLVRLYGDVPLMVRESEASANIARAPKEQVYQQIIKDAQEAAQGLPVKWDERNVDRATRGAALTLLADVHLTRRDWERAAAAARAVMDLQVYTLYPNYLQAFLAANENGPEHVFSLEAMGAAAGGPGSSFVSLYYPRELGVNQGGGFATIQPTLLQYNSYAAGDYRKEVSYFTRALNSQNRMVTFAPHVHKYRPADVRRIGSGDVDWPIYRYAEVLLIYAEALNELNRPAEAVQHLNAIRARARRGTGAESRAQPANYDGPLTQAALRDAIYDERRWELAHEAKRWYDLIRRGEPYFMQQMGRDPEATDLEPTDALWPIPQSEIDLNGALVQNPGY